MTGCKTTGYPNLPKGAIGVIAHRGASAYAPENTLASFALAKELGADWFELDCALTKDGEVIVIHDSDTERTTGVKGKIYDRTLAELKTLDASSWKDPKFAGEKLPTLAEALELAKKLDTGIYIEVKNVDDDSAAIAKIIQMAQDKQTLTPAMRRQAMAEIRDSKSRNIELTQKVIDLVEKYHMGRHIVIQSFSPVVCAVALDEAPRLRTELLASKDEDHPERWPMYLRWNALFRPAGFNTTKECADSALIAQMRQQGQTLAIWTIDDEADMRQLAQGGIDHIITNKPDVCLKVLKEIGKR